MEDKKFWLDGFEGPAKGGLFVRSGIAKEIADYEAKFNVKVVALGFETDYETGKPSWNLELITEVTSEDVERFKHELGDDDNGTS